MDAEVDMHDFEIYKKKFNIEVDETAHDFPHFVRHFMTRMRQAEVDAALTTESQCRPPQRHDCCIICSADEDDLGHAQRFKEVLSINGFIACVLQESQLTPANVLDQVKEMLDGSSVVFLLCTPSLLHDGGIAKMAFQDQLQTHLSSDRRPGKKICPVVLPQPTSSVCGGSSGAGALPSLTSMRSSGYLDTCNVLSRKRTLPIGITQFKSITLQNPEVYMKQVRWLISVTEQQSVRAALEEEVQKRRLVHSRVLRAKQQEAVTESVRLFNEPVDTLLQFERCIKEHQGQNKLDASLKLSTDGIRSSLGALSSPDNNSFVRYPAGLEGMQIINMNNCSNISFGTSYHVSENTAL